MPLTSQVLPFSSSSVPRFPKLMEHIPTGCIVLFVDSEDGWLVSDPKKLSHRPLGTGWANCKDGNYRDFYSEVKITNEF